MFLILCSIFFVGCGGVNCEPCEKEATCDDTVHPDGENLLPEADELLSDADEPTVVLESFIPLMEDDGCEVAPDSHQWYSRGYLDVAFATQYRLPFRTIDSLPAEPWQLTRMTFSYELPPIPGVDPAVWDDRTVHSFPRAESDGAVTVATVLLVTDEIYKNLIEIFDIFASSGVSFDWESYPVVVTVQAAGVRPGNETLIWTGELIFELVPLYAQSIRSAAIYPDKAWPTDQKIEAEYPPTEWAEKKYERDKDIYDTMLLNCDFSEDHLIGCLPGQDYGLIDCYTYTEAATTIETLFPGYLCCPKDEPVAPVEPNI